MTITETLRPEVVADRQIAAAWAAFYTARRPGDSLYRQAKSYRQYASWYPKRRDDYLAQAKDAETRAEAAYDAAEPLRIAAGNLDRALYKGWQRFFLVDLDQSKPEPI